MDRLIEPLGLLHGPAARSACDAGLTLPLAGGTAAFALCALIEHDNRRVVPVRDIPSDWMPWVERVVASPPMAGLPPGPLVMGILNATPDSFSDGGLHASEAEAMAAGRRMVAYGAALIDVGGESTRPGALPVAEAEEAARIVGIVRGLAGDGVVVSVDTRNAGTMRSSLAAGACLVNDVSALAHDPEARGVIARAGCAVVLMHMRGTPQDMASHASYRDVAVEVVRELGRSIAAAVAAGVARDRILVDPGIGFAKDAEHNLELLRRLPLLANLGCRVVLGVSRKGFIGRIAGGAAAGERVAGSLAAALPALSLSHSILRVHDVAETVQAVRLWQAIHG